MNTLSPSRLAAQASKVLAGAAVGMLAFASFAQSAGAQSSWNPTLLVNTESFQMIDRGDGTTDIELRFGLSTQFIKFLTSNKFQFSHGISVLGTMSGSNLNVDRNATIGGQLTVTGAITGMNRITAKTVLSGQTLRVSGNADVNGSLSVTGSILTEGDLTLGGDDAATNVTLTFMNSGTDETLTWLDTADKFQFSDDVSVVGNLSGSSLRIDGLAEVQGPLAVSGAIRGDANLTINDDQTAADAVFTFGSDGTNETITWANTADRFEFSDDVLVNGYLRVTGNLSGSSLRVDGLAEVQGPLAVSGAVRTDSNLTLNDDQTATDVALTFGSDGTNEALTWMNTADKFYLSDDLDVNGTISGTTLKISGNGTHTMSGSLTIESALSGSTIEGFGLASCNGASQKLVYNAATDKFECAADQTGAGTNGSGQIISLHPEYAGAIYFASGSSYIGQMTLSGGTTDLDNAYRWSSSKPTLQQYWVSTRVRLPDNFSTWDVTKPIEFRYKTGVASTTNNHLTVRIKDTAGVERTLTGGGDLASTSWTTASIKGPETGGTWTPKGYITIYVKLAADNTSNAYAAAGFINLNFESTLP